MFRYQIIYYRTYKDGRRTKPSFVVLSGISLDAVLEKFKERCKDTVIEARILTASSDPGQYFYDFCNKKLNTPMRSLESTFPYQPFIQPRY